MDHRNAELASSATTLEALIATVTRAADDAAAIGDEAVSHDLYEVERALRSASRRLTSVVRRARG